MLRKALPAEAKGANNREERQEAEPRSLTKSREPDGSVEQECVWSEQREGVAALAVS